ncbi:MAG: hypothetical protein ACOX58_02170 [Christensenellales bacterium]|jgi:riboflavin kinase/FMN adenylyltransferase
MTCAGSEGASPLLIEWLGSEQPVHKPSVVCLGFFDGIHLGHQAILDAARAIHMREGLVFCVHTYDQMPARVLFPDKEFLELTPFEEKSALFKALGVELLAVSHFDDALRHMTGEAFVQMLVERLQVRHIVAGYDHRFGYRGDTDAKRLTQLCHQQGIGITIVPPVSLSGGQAISSTAIRAALAQGNIRQAEAMLGRPISVYMRSLAGSA